MAMIRVGVVRGGPSSEYEVSLKTGQSVLDALPKSAYHPQDILITKSGDWHHNGLPTNPEKMVRQVDVIFNALHGEYGEDGRIQNVLDKVGIPYTGSGIFASAVSMNKALAKDVFRKYGLKTPYGISLRQNEQVDPARTAFEKISPPWIVKPTDRGSSVGLTLARTYPELIVALKKAFQYSDKVLVEQYIAGREATCGVLDHFRNVEHYALPVIEIRRPGNKSVWDYQDKYSGETEEICPANFNDEEKKTIEEMATRAHSALGLRHYSRSDFIITPRGIYLLEVNTLPGLTSESLLPKSLAAVGCAYPDFLDHLIQLALRP